MFQLNTWRPEPVVVTCALDRSNSASPAMTVHVSTAPVLGFGSTAKVSSLVLPKLCK